MSIEKNTKITSKIALTGGIASGKTYASNFIKTLGIPVIDLDDVSKKITNENIANIIAIFGKNITTNSQLDKKKLKTLVFNNLLEMQKLEDFLHPKILKEMQEKIQKLELLGNRKIIIVVPLLIEKNLYHYFNRAIVIMTNKKTQKQRMIIRDNIDDKLAENILSAQATNSQRKNVAAYLPTDFITNNTTAQELETQIKHLIL